MPMNMHDILRKDPGIWDLFTRKEEYGTPLRDAYDRFPCYASTCRDIFEPQASQYLVGHGYSVKYPGNAPFALCLTHDIDCVYQGTASKLISAQRSLFCGNQREAIHSIARMRSKKLPLCNFSAIMDLEEKYGAKSTFFFLAERSGEQDFSYDVEDLEPEIRNIIQRGWEVGLHGGHTTYLNVQEMTEKKMRLEAVTHTPVTGYRNHYLRFRVPDTWEHLSKAGFLYDSTLGYADCAGFRNGMCHPFRPFSLDSNQEIAIQEIPLIVMDDTLGPAYMRLDGTTAWSCVKNLIDRVADCHGVFTLLWHNYAMEGESLALYEKILHYGKERRAWLTSGAELCTKTIVDVHENE